MANVFVGHDYVLDEVFDHVAEQLGADGNRIIRGPEHIPPHPNLFPQSTWDDLFGQVEVMVVSTRTIITKELLESAPHLRAIVFPSIGFDAVDAGLAAELGIMVVNGPTAENFESMAEATVMLAAALLHELPIRQRQFRESLPRPASSDMTSRMLGGKTVGLLGFGNIAQEVVRRLHGWGVDRILVATRTPPNTRQWPQIELVDFETALAESDVLSVHLPLSEQTKAILGADQFKKMKQGSVLINTARGGIVDEHALAEAIASGHLGGAALDCFENEPASANHPLARLDNVILTQHIVGHTQESFASLIPTTVQNVRTVLHGDIPKTLRNPGALRQLRPLASQKAG